MDCVHAENDHPGPRNVMDGARTIYTSRRLEYNNILTYPILCDFGSATIIQEYGEGVIQPLPYRAPEVIMRLKWNSSADIWNLGIVVRRKSLLEEQHANTK